MVRSAFTASGCCAENARPTIRMSTISRRVSSVPSSFTIPGFSSARVTSGSHTTPTSACRASSFFNASDEPSASMRHEPLPRNAGTSKCTAIVRSRCSLGLFGVKATFTACMRFSASRFATRSFHATIASPPLDSSITATIVPGKPFGAPFSRYASTVATANCSVPSFSFCMRAG